jgi:hypothetical protein
LYVCTEGGEYMRPIKTVIGLFTESKDVEGALNELKSRGYNPKDISMIMKDTREAKKIQENTGADVGAGAATGAATGAVIGGLTGLLLGVGAITIPGVGAFLIGGPLAAALGLSGAAATTATGAMTGALAGGLIGALMSLGLPREEAERYETRIKEGAILLAVPAFEGQEMEVSQTMDKFGASDIKTLQTPIDADRADDRQDDWDERDIDDRSYATAGDPSQLHEGYSVHDAAHHHKGDHHEHRMHQDDDANDYHAANPVQIQKYLKHVDYPASKEDLIHEAEEEGANRDVIQTLKDMPEEKFDSPTDVSRAIGHIK